MIESITISDIATFYGAPTELKELTKFNYLFGANGTGKTTISRVIADQGGFPTCTVVWCGGTKLEPMVYNRDFVERNFNQSAELKGVFTLGEKQVATLEKIKEVKSEIDAFTVKIEGLTQGVQGTDGAGGKKAELVGVESAFKEKCWAQKQKHDQNLHGAFEGYRNNTEKFKGKVLLEKNSNTEAPLPLSELEKKAITVFGPTPTVENPVPAIDAVNLLRHESNPILKKRVIGKEDVDIAAMIKKLGNSDWVRQGRPFLDVNEGHCPFCQQRTPDSFAEKLNEYFDENFVKDSKAVEDLANSYSTDADRVQQQLASIIASPSKFLDIEKLKIEKELLDSKITLNTQLIAGKRREASRVVELESLDNVITAIMTLLDSANAQIVEHNKMVANLSRERSTLTAQVWRYVLEELKLELVKYESDRDGLAKAIASMTEQIEKAVEEKAKKVAELRDLERQTTSIQPTIDGINALLANFGFQGFKLAKTASGDSYKLVRPDGSDAKATLSEGEKTFVTFLYFYYLLKGSMSDSGMTIDRVVVFDDPVSSLDSDILFIVSSLIKALFDDIRAQTGHIKQIFILTHNVYFHKEITFNPKRHGITKDETFWVVRKKNLLTNVEKHNRNPIKTSYDLLWSEVRREDRSKLTIQNTLRRILENYFKILGGVDPDKICEMFEGKEKLICKSLFSWVHDGSHFAHDDLYVSIDDAQVEGYLRVFRAIFEKSGHGSHYRMMMGEAFEESVAEDA